MQDILALHTLVARNHIGDGVIAHMAHVQFAAWVGKHGETVKFLPGRVFTDPETLAFLPVLLGALLNVAWQILFIECGLVHGRLGRVLYKKSGDYKGKCYAFDDMTPRLPDIKTRLLPPYLPVLCLLALALQNLLIFWQHHTGDATFLNDFTRIIYPMTAFWITLVQHGLFPEWTPFQSMGMPFVLSMQSGVFYPPLWLFAIVKAPFTLHMANVVQALHVLWGAIGCWLYIRLLGRSCGVALFAAIAFQFFGGFYSNAEHSDIIRAFSFIPWLFWAIQIMPTQTQLAGRNWLAPLLLMLFVTGAYQGNLVAHLFVLGVFWILSWLDASVHEKHLWRAQSALHLQIAALLLLGILLSCVYLLPTLAVKSYLARDGVWTGQTSNWPASYWNSLIMPSNAGGLFMLPSMLSAFITVPVFCLLFLVTSRCIKQNGLWCVITVLALLMASGSSLPVYGWLVKLFPPLGASRFPSSDYRALFAFGLLVLSSAVLDDYLKGKVSASLKKRAGICLALLLFFTLANYLAIWLASPAALETVNYVKSMPLLATLVWSVLVFVSSAVISAEITEWPLVIVLSSLVFFALYRFRQQSLQLLSLLLILEMISGWHAIHGMAAIWRNEVATDLFYQEVDSASPYTVMQVIDHPVAQRPACHDMYLFLSSWRGYLLGDYMCQTQDSKTRPRETIGRDPLLNVYMREAWQPRLITRAQQGLCQPELIKAGSAAAAPIQLQAYGLQRIEYHVQAAGDFCFVENELLFPGWTGNITFSQTPIQAQRYCGALRSWCLPGGDYQFTASYRAPWLREGAVLSLLFFGFYIAAYVYWRRRCKK